VFSRTKRTFFFSRREDPKLFKGQLRQQATTFLLEVSPCIAQLSHASNIVTVSCTPGDTYDHMHMERLRRHVARCVCEKKGKVEEETLTDLKMILTSQDNLKTRWFFAFAFGIFRCTPSDNYDHMHMEGLRRHVARCMQ
jgi:hypothetical protein